MIKFPFCYIIYWTHILGNMEIEYSGLQNSSPNTRASFETPICQTYCKSQSHERSKNAQGSQHCSRTFFRTAEIVDHNQQIFKAKIYKWQFVQKFLCSKTHTLKLFHFFHVCKQINWRQNSFQGTKKTEILPSSLTLNPSPTLAPL